MSEARCRLCAHPDRPDIDAAIAGGMSNVAAAERWALSKDGVRRHRASHLSLSLQAVTKHREEAGASKAVDRAEDLYVKASALLDAATADGKPSLSLQAIAQLKSIVELLARLSGELDERPTVQVLNVSTSPEWAEVRGVVLGALLPFPEAHQALAGALQGMKI